MTLHTTTVPRLPVEADALGYFRFGSLAGGVILTNEFGEWHFLSPEDFRLVLAGTMPEEHAEYAALCAKGIIREGLELDAHADAMRRRKRFIGVGPALHQVRMTDSHGALSVEVAKEIIDHAMLSTSSRIVFRLAQGEGPVSLDLLQFFARYSTEKNRYEGKTLVYELVTDCVGADEELASWLVDKRFRVRSGVGGDGTLSADQSAFLTHLAAAATKRRRAETPFTAVVHLGADHASGDAIYGALAEASISSCRLEPVLEGDKAIDDRSLSQLYSAFLDAQLAAASAGGRVLEEVTAGMLHKALRTDAVDDPSLRSPSSGVQAYDTAGRIFPTERAADLFAAGDAMFLLGEAGVTSYKDAVAHPTRRALTLASTLEALPGTCDHWSTPFWGVDPVLTYARSGDLFPKMPTAPQARSAATFANALFGRMVHADPERMETFRALLA